MKKKRTRAGSSKKNSAAMRALFVEAHIANGGNGMEAAKTAGYSPKSAKCKASLLLKDPKIAEAIEKRRAEVLAKAQEKTELTAVEVMESLARDLRFDPAKLYDDKRRLKPIPELDEDTRMALRGVEIDEIKIGRGENAKAIGNTVKIKFPEKTAAREQGMKRFGLYKLDNEQKPATVLVSGQKTVKFERFKGRSSRA